MIKILIAVDGSDSSNRAIGAVARLANKAAPLQVTLLNVCCCASAFPGDTLDAGTVEVLPEQRHQVLLLERASALARTHGLRVRCMHASSRSVAQEIVRVAETAGADQIVMGSHGMKSNGHYVLGSVAQKVVQITSTPVVLVR